MLKFTMLCALLLSLPQLHADKQSSLKKAYKQRQQRFAVADDNKMHPITDDEAYAALGSFSNNIRNMQSEQVDAFAEVWAVAYAHPKTRGEAVKSLGRAELEPSVRYRILEVSEMYTAKAGANQKTYKELKDRLPANLKKIQS